ncbi:FAD/NAD(P)-binding oxidoreductase, partial [Pseudomonas sp. 5S2]|nr:FAD/NAD(P)-binding oxidoreductase [Pseudomonas sp. 5S2]
HSVFQRTSRQVYGFEARKAQAVHRTMDELAALIDYRPDTLVWIAEDGRVYMLNNGRADGLDYAQVIVATGAADRIL